MQKLLIATSLLFAACHNPNYCAGNPDHNCNETGDGGAGSDGRESISCVNTGCVGNTAGSVCDVTTKACVQCTVADHSACSLTTPVCKLDACVACTANADCSASNTCLPDGSCAAATDVAYVSSTGTGDCLSAASACSKVTTAQGTGRSVIRVSGTITDNVSFSGGASRFLIGDDAGASTITNTTGTLLSLNGSSAKFVVSKINFLGVSGNTVNVVSIINDGTHQPSLEMHQCSIENGGGTGIFSTGGTVLFERGVISGNTGGGVSLSATNYHFTNAIIATNNGTGGMYLVAGNGVVEFSTIADNMGTNIGASRGTNCQSTSALFDSVILHGNATTQTSGSGCAFVYSNLWPQAAPSASANTNDFNMQLTFTGFYRLATGSSMKDIANPTSNVMLDIDNDVRPQGIARDIGADELP